MNHSMLNYSIGKSIHMAIEDSLRKKSTNNYLIVLSGERNDSDVLNDISKHGAAIFKEEILDTYTVLYLPEGVIETIDGIESYDNI